MKHIKQFEGFIDTINQKVVKLSNEAKREIEVCLQALIDDYDIGYYRVITAGDVDVIAFVYKLNDDVKLTDEFKTALDLANKKLSHIGLEIKFGKVNTTDAYQQLGVTTMKDWDEISKVLLKFKCSLTHMDILIVDKDTYNDETNKIVQWAINLPRN